MKDKKLIKNIIEISLPVTLQSLLQSSFCIVDQIMVAKLGSTSIAGLGLAGKFVSIFTVLANAFATVMGILLAQYIGKKNNEEISRSFFTNLSIGVVLAVLFTIPSILIPEKIIGLYSNDPDIIQSAAVYLKAISFIYLPMMIAILISTLLRCLEKAEIPLYITMIGMVCNTALNYILIFGKFGISPMKEKGAAYASFLSQSVICVCLLLITINLYRRKSIIFVKFGKYKKEMFLQYLYIGIPILVCEFLWGLGENVYAVIYGHIGKLSCAAMTLLNPVQSLTIGALSGMAQAASIIVGKELGKGEYDKAYTKSKHIIWYGAVGAIILTFLILLTRHLYLNIYGIEEEVYCIAEKILIVFSVILPVKVLNMILGGGIVRSGGKTKYILLVDLIGTWGIGVPVGLISAFVLKYSIAWTYLLLSMEEVVRLLITIKIFRNKKWMNSLIE